MAVDSRFEIRLDGVKEVGVSALIFHEGKRGELAIGFRTLDDLYAKTAVRFTGNVEDLLMLAEALAKAGPRLAEDIRRELQNRIEELESKIKEREQRVAELEKKLAESWRVVAAGAAAAAEGEEETDGGA